MSRERDEVRAKYAESVHALKSKQQDLDASLRDAVAHVKEVTAHQTSKHALGTQDAILERDSWVKSATSLMAAKGQLQATAASLEEEVKQLAQERQGAEAK
eukprot:CAMPEP_0179334246 /NCGR_PEP_ID=MMETSP0797-20121207/65830_1 /TAXON_ID=47934 /ORGANISM="Dinophysis acuminata, Strain DAEP01" /LENGTH=100 /DNA_ID=CAMNT_0021047499 /DNA_START=3 /DNA_END=305 /DNA_ORIENTATION=-